MTPARLFQPNPRRARFLLWALLAMLLQGFVALQHDVAMAQSLELCGPADRSGDSSHAPAGQMQHDCCVVAASQALLPDVPHIGLTPLPVLAPVQAPRAVEVPAQWLAPLSRGPPVIEVV